MQRQTGEALVYAEVDHTEPPIRELLIALLNDSVDEGEQSETGERPLELYTGKLWVRTMLRMVPSATTKLLTQMRRGAIEYCVLALLQGEDRYGFELTRTLAAADGLVTSEGTIYPLLARLRQEGLVKTTWKESQQGPPRRYYRITKDGKAALEAFTVQWHRFRDTVDLLLDGGDHERS